MNVAEIIAAKRDGNALSQRQIEFMVSGHAQDIVPDYQMSAFAMAVFFQGMTKDETAALTRAMLESGDQMRWPPGKPKVDKHSTGGIGDKISIALAPLLACCGVDVPMISGRGLGPTGGTLDKLESIPGFRCNLSLDEFRSIVNGHGCCITGASDNLAPADKKLYALRDVTATVPSIPLITASILSKKVAEGLDFLLLDVKCGSGAFMKTRDQARNLALSLVDVGNMMGVKTGAIITDMSQPLGKMVGNGVEVDECIDILCGTGPADASQLTLDLCSRLLTMAGVESNLKSAEVRLQRAIDTGSALERLNEMVQAQGGDLNAPRARGKKQVVLCEESGFVCRIDAERVGLALIEMGGGRRKMGDLIDHSAGLEFLVRIGDNVERGQPIAHVFCDTDAAKLAAQLISMSVSINTQPAQPMNLIIETVE
jgi:pyrimidine-nucleoside phosphorylase